MEINDKLREFIRKELIPVNQQTEAEQNLFVENAGLMELPQGECLFNAGATDGYTYYLMVGKLDMQSVEGTNTQIDSNADEARYPLAQVLPRKYTAKAITPSWILRIDSKFISTASGSLDNPTSEEDASGADWMTRLLESHIFRNIPVENFQRIFTLFEQLNVKQGDTIIQQGEAGDYYYIIDNGRFQVSRVSGDKIYKLAELKNGEGFGEEALIGNTKRNATVTAATDGKLVRIKKDDFLTLVKDPAVKSVSYDETKELVKQGAICIDARFKQEYQKAPAKLKNSINIPINVLRLEADALDKNKQYIIYCDTGARSSIEAFLLLEKGFNVCHLTGGIESMIAATKNKEQTTDDLGELNRKTPAEAIPEPQSNVKAITTAKTEEDTNIGRDDILSKLNIDYGGDMNELSKVLSIVLSNVYTQLEAALKEKVEAEIAKSVAEEKLQHLIDNKNN